MSLCSKMIVASSPLGATNTPFWGLYNNLRNDTNVYSFSVLDMLVKPMTQWLWFDGVFCMSSSRVSQSVFFLILFLGLGQFLHRAILSDCGCGSEQLSWSGPRTKC